MWRCSMSSPDRTRRSARAVAIALFVFLAASPAVAGAAPSPGTAARADSLIGAAVSAARNDEHARSIDLYRHAVEVDPDRRMEVAPALARELTWAGRYDEAEAELARYADQRPKDRDVLLHRALNASWAGRIDAAIEIYRALLHDAPEDLEASLGLARMLAWAGRLTDAEREYARTSARHAGISSAELGRAQVLNWSGRSREALRIYESVLGNEPGNEAALEGKVLAEKWIGRTDRALAALEERRDGGATAPAARRLETAIRKELAPRTTTQGDYFEDSQDFRLWSVRQEVTVYPEPLVRLSPSLSYRHEERPGEFDIDEVWAGLGAAWRLSTGLSLSGSATVIPDPAVAEGAPNAAGDLHLLIEPDDVLKVTLAGSRSLYTVMNRFTPEPRLDRLAGDAVGFAASRNIDTRSSIAVNYDYSMYGLAGDAAARFRHNGRARVRSSVLSGRPKMWMEFGYQHIDFNGWAPIGVWTPDRFQSWQLAVDTEWRPGAGWTLSGGLQGGTQREQQKDEAGQLAGDWAAFGGFTARLSGRIAGFDAYLGGGHANASFETGRGYRRSYLYAGVTRGF